MIRPKIKPVRSVAARQAWARAHARCQSCGKSWSDARHDIMGLTVHHCVKWRRADEATNLLMLCMQCHDLAEGRNIRVDGVLLPKLTLGVCLAIKKFREPDEYDEARLTELFGRRLPDLEPLPEWCK